VVLNYPNGFASASGTIVAAWAAAFSGAAINLTNLPTQHQAGGTWYTSQANITSFTSDFTFQITPSGTVPSIQGITFCVQNSNTTTSPSAYGDNASADSNMLGYGAYDLTGQHAVQKSIAVKFDLNSSSQNNYSESGTPSSTGLYVNGGPLAALIPQQDLNPAGINLYAGHVMAAHIVYDGTILTMVLRDTVTGTQVRETWPVNIPAVLGSNSGWVGFTGGEIPVEPQDILSWTFSEGYATRLPTPAFSVGAGSYASSQTVSISAPSGATVYYTTNGRQPTATSTKYTGPITVSSSEVVQAVSIESGYTDSYVAEANYQIAPAGTPIINFPSGFASASNLIAVNGVAKFNGSALQLTDTSQFNEAGSAWYVAPVNVQSFTTHFTLQLTSPLANGMTFTIQNQTPPSSDTSSLFVSGGPNALANSSTGLGYSGSTGDVGGQISGLTSSVAVKFDLFTGTGDETGLVTNGGDTTLVNVDMSSSGLSLKSGNPLAVTMVYDGTTLTLTITDTKTSASFTHSWAINIPSTVGGNTAYVGFTAGTGGLTAQQSVTAWTYAQ
jgi:Legume lectin domain/Chitobiase/beta-hexosaminidase C-terminal domain